MTTLPSGSIPQDEDLNALPQDGVGMMDQIIATDSLTLFLDRDPYSIPYTDAELVAKVVTERQARARYNVKQEVRRTKRKERKDDAE